MGGIVLPDLAIENRLSSSSDPLLEKRLLASGLDDIFVACSNCWLSGAAFLAATKFRQETHKNIAH